MTIMTNYCQNYVYKINFYEMMMLSYEKINKMFKIKFPNKRSAVDLAHKTYGNIPSDKPPVIILHGLLGSKKNWESMSKMIASSTQRTVVAADMRNHGDSPHVSSHTYTELASDVSQLIVKLSASKASIIGHSMGGRTAMVLALTEPMKLESLIVADISPIPTAGALDNFFPELIRTMKTVNFKEAENVVKARINAKKVLKAAGINMDFIPMNVGLRTDKTIGWKYNLDALAESFSAIANFPPEMAGKTYDGPTLFIGGQESHYIPPNDLAGIRKFFPRAELKYISGAGHMVHVENPSAFLKMATDFLKQ